MRDGVKVITSNIEQVSSGCKDLFVNLWIILSYSLTAPKEL